MPAFATVVYENRSPFGVSASSPTLVPPGDTLFVGNRDQSAPSWFEVPAQSYAQFVQIQFTAATLRTLEGGSVVPVETLGEGSSLPSLGSTPTILRSVSVTEPIITSEGSSLVGSSSFEPVLQLNLLKPAASSSAEGGTEGSSVPLATVVPPDAAGVDITLDPSGFNSYTVDLVLPAGDALPLSFDYDFDYTLDIQTSPAPAPARVPEPATAALLGLGLVGLAVARRRRRTSII